MRAFLWLLVFLLGQNVNGQDWLVKARQLESHNLKDPKAIGFAPEEVVAPGNTPVFLHLAEHGRESRIRVGALLALASRLRGTIKGTYKFESLPFKPEIPGDEARRVILKCLQDPDPWVRKKAWGVVGTGFLQKRPPDPVMVDFVSQGLVRLAKPDSEWESNYCAKTTYYLSQPAPKLEAVMLACAQTTRFPNTFGHFTNSLAYHSETFPRRPEFVKVFLTRLQDPNGEIRWHCLQGLERALTRAEISGNLKKIEALKKDPVAKVRDQADLTYRRLQSRMQGAR